MNGYREQLARVLAAVQIVSATAHTWFGARSNGLPADTERLMQADSARAYLLYNLQAQLYADFYCAGSPRPPLENPVATPPPGLTPFTQALSHANAGRGAREPGWTLVRKEEGALVVQRDGLSLWVAPDEVHAASGAGVAPGAPVSVHMPKELLRLSPGFYMALGEAELALDGSQPVVRHYWNLHSEGAPLLIEALTRRLNDASVAFRVKVASDPALYSRCDAGVLYTLSSEYTRVRAVVEDVYELVAPALKPATPALTKQLAPGLGLAEDPGVQMTSFGMSRCRLLAESILVAAERGVSDPAQRLALVAERFAQEGIDLDTPYLNGGSHDRYEPLETMSEIKSATLQREVAL